jgi:cytochrome bd ubiquinol oxidase subunit II
MITLPDIWFALLCLEMALYVMLDGGDLGIGVLSLLSPQEEHRAVMMNAIGPIWDANETWLVIAGGTLFGAFPLAYGIVLNALYIPVMLTIFGFILRAASFEFYAHATHKEPWGFLFGFGNTTAAVGQGLVAGGLLSGITIQHGVFAGGALSWLSPITFLVAAGVVTSYIVVGYAYLIKQKASPFRTHGFHRLIIAAGATFLAFLTVTVLLPTQHYIFFERWSVEPSRSILIGISVAIALVSLWLLVEALMQRRPRRLHPLCQSIFALAFVGLLVGIFPYIVPPGMTLSEAAASLGTLRFMLWGIGPLLPIILTYNFYLYRVFRYTH